MSATIDRPAYTLEVAFNTGAPSWTTIPNLRSFAIKRGRNDELGAVQAGTLDVVVGNPTGALSPDNAAGPYYPNILPVNAIRLTATYGGTSYVRFRGFVQSWVPVDNTAVDSDVHISAVDFFNLAALGVLNASFPAQDEGARIGAVLDALDTRSLPRALDPGPENVLAATLVNVPALQHIADVLAGERGVFFCAADGTLTYHNRNRRFTATRSKTSQGTYGQSLAAGALNYVGLAYTYDDRYLYNEIRVTAPDGEQVASDSASQTRYGRRVLTLNAPWLLPGQGATLASYLLLSYKAPHARLGGVALDSDANASGLLPKILSAEISDRVTVQKSGPGSVGLNRDFWIDGIQEAWDADGQGGHRATWLLSDPAAYGLTPFLLDSSLLDGTDTLAY